MSNYCWMPDCYIDRPHEHQTATMVTEEPAPNAHGQSWRSMAERALQSVGLDAEGLTDIGCLDVVIEMLRQASKPAEGTWQWAIGEIKAGKQVARREWPDSSYLTLGAYGPENLLVLVNQYGTHQPPCRLSWFEAHDWRLAPPATEPKKES